MNTPKPPLRQKDKYRIFDDIYGLVEFNGAEKRVIDSLLFQRLRRVKQLGLAQLVFPGAIHTRFSHSIGTFAVAQRVIRALRLESEDAKNLRMAALLHDIGHFPLSHTIEKVYNDERKERFKFAQKDKIELQNSAETPQIESITREGGKLALHEEMSGTIIVNTDYEGGITKILNDEGYYPFEISNIVTGRSDNNMFNQLMHSDIDVDQMDYLIRDAKNAGITYGTCDVDYLISNMIKVSYNELGVLFFNLKAMRALEHFFLARYFYYTQILYHKTRSVIEKSAQMIYKYALDKELEIKGKPIYSYKNLDELYKTQEDILEFDDSYFDCVLKVVLAECNQNDEIIKKHAHVISQRKIPELIMEKFRKIKKNNNKFTKKSEENTDNKPEVIIINEEFDIMDDYDKIKKRSLASGDEERLYEDREAVRIYIDDKYEYEPKKEFLVNFEDSILKELVKYRFEILRKYKFR